MTITAKPNLRALVHTPADLAVEYVTYVENVKRYPGVTWGVPSLDRTIIPLRPGDVAGIIARPGHGKSTLSAFLSRRTAQAIASDPARAGECVVYVTFEQSTEEIEAFFQIDSGEYSVTDLAWGRVDIEQIKRHSLKRPSLPVYLIGKSVTSRVRVPRMTVDNVYGALSTMRDDYGVKPILIVLDYVQIIPVDRAADRVHQVGEAIVRSKELALDMACPIVNCVQAGRAVDSRESKMPGAGDCQWASAIEQVSDKLLGIWRPALTEEGSTVKVNDMVLPLTQSLFIAKLQKQRMSSAGHVYYLHFEPQLVKLADMELQEVRL